MYTPKGDLYTRLLLFFGHFFCISLLVFVMINNFKKNSLDSFAIGTAECFQFLFIYL